jgi:hypothetical protein
MSVLNHKPPRLVLLAHEQEQRAEGTVATRYNTLTQHFLNLPLDLILELRQDMIQSNRDGPHTRNQGNMMVIFLVRCQTHRSGEDQHKPI